MRQNPALCDNGLTDEGPLDICHVEQSIGSAKRGPTTQSQLLMTLKKDPFENIVGKKENAGNQYFLFFPTMFSILSRTNFAI